MSSASLLRFAARSSSSTIFRSSCAVRRVPAVPSASGSAVVVPVLSVAYGYNNFSTSVRRQSDDAHAEESFEEFTARYGSSALLHRRAIGCHSPQGGSPETFSRLLRKSKIYHKGPNYVIADMRRNSRASKMSSSSRSGPPPPISGTVFGILTSSSPWLHSGTSTTRLPTTSCPLHQ